MSWLPRDASEFCWVFVESGFAGGGAEIESFAVVIGFEFCFFLVNHHAANWIFSHNHFHLTLDVYCFTLFDLNLANFKSAELLTTVKLLIAIAPAAYMGFSKPKAAIGIITTL